MKRFLAATALVVVALGVFALSDTASATNGVLDNFTATYPSTAGTALDSCSTCHTSVPALNAYGSAVRAGGMNFAGIEGLDSDGDGFSNLQEIRALTLPGSSSSRPTTPTTTSTTTSTSTTSTTSAGTMSTTSTTNTTAVAAPQLAAAAPPAAVGAGPSGSSAFEVKGVGTVWLAIEDGSLVVSRVDTTWQYKIEMDDDHEIEIKFRSGDQEIEFEAELEDGSIRTKLEVESDDDHSRPDDNDHDGADHDDDRGDHHEDNHSRSDDDHEDDRGSDHDD